ncbi:MAG: hypothetical protein AAF589_01920 [Planctomycetota bacterium]
MKKAFRARLLIDPKLQGALLLRVVLYWCVCVLVVMVLASLQTLWSSPGAGTSVIFSRAMLAFGPSLIASLIILPIVLFDALRFSHRFVGPMHRLRTIAQTMADGKAAPSVKFRDGDYWCELADQFNRVGQELQRLRAGSEPSEAAAADQEAGAAESVSV